VTQTIVQKVVKYEGSPTSPENFVNFGLHCVSKKTLM